jgi:serine/threonine protein kinase
MGILKIQSALRILGSNKLSLDFFEKIGILGSGGFSTVWKVKCNKISQLFAIKQISKSQISKKTIESLGIHISDDKIKIIIREIVNFIRYLPYFGEIINNIINGSLSGISTFVIGYNLVKKYEREVKINYEMNLFLEAIESFNEAVEGIKKLKERIYFETN